MKAYLLSLSQNPVSFNPYLELLENRAHRESSLEQITVRIKQIHQQCQTSSEKGGLIFACQAGKMLLEVQSLFTPEEWSVWLKDQCNLSEKAAKSYMEMAQGWSGLPTQHSQKTSLSSQIPSPIKPKVTVNSGKNLSAQKTTLVEIITPDKQEEIEQKIPHLKSVELLEITPTESRKKPLPCLEIIKLWIPGNVVPKARPRVTRNGTYLPKSYRAWRNHAEVEIYRQLSELNLQGKLPIQKANITCRFLGSHRRNSDLDNLAGACLDALTLKGAGVIQDDRVSCVPKLNVEYEPDAKKTGVWIKIEPIITFR